ncbi:MAG: hypothetical protein ACRELB_23345 [Polyangiaceae bacterium]
MVLVGAGTSAFFALRKPRQDTLAPSGADLSPVLLCGVNRCQ